MIPNFPEFKKLELSDKDEIESFTKKFPPYSDFNFVSIWSWNIKNEIEISILENNLVVKFTDYLTGDPVFSFIGVHSVEETAQKLLDFDGFDSYLNFVPKEVAERLDKNRFEVEENHDQNDYVYSIKDLIEYNGSALKNHRNSLSSFNRKYPNSRYQLIDIENPLMRESMIKLCKIWENNKNNKVPHEYVAINKCISDVDKFSLFCVGIFVEGDLIAFNINQIDNEEYATCFFAKGDISYYGVYSALMNATAKIIDSDYGAKYLNYEQDLGLFNLRKSKESFGPIYFLKKYCIFRKV